MTRAAEHGIMVSKPCCHPESTLFVRTKDPGAPRNHSRVRCENANQRVWRASLTPPMTLMLEHRTRPPRANQSHQVQGRRLEPYAVHQITLKNCQPELGDLSFAENSILVL